jgi:hypothetical protein
MTKQSIEDDLEMSESQKVHIRGQRLGTYLENLIVGWSTVIMQVFNVGISIATALFVADMMHSMTHAGLKMSVFNIIGAMSAIILASRLSLLKQLQVKGTRLLLYAKQASLEKDYTAWVVRKMNGDWYRQLVLAVLCIIIAVFVHGTNIFIMLSAFSDSALMKEMGVTSGRATYMLAGIGLEIVSLLVDFYLGFSSTIKLDMEKYQPDENEVITVIARSEKYKKFLKYLEDFKKQQSGSGNGQKEGKQNGGNKSGNNSNSGSGNKTPVKLPKPQGPLPDLSSVTSPSELLARVLVGTNFHPQRFSSKLAKMSDQKRRKDITADLSKLVRKFRSLYKQGSDSQRWVDSGDDIWKQVQATITETQVLLNKVGYTLKKTS